MARLKVFGGFINGKRAIMAAYSRDLVAVRTGVSRAEIIKFWSETRSKYEIELATTYPGTLFVGAEPISMNFKEMT